MLHIYNQFNLSLEERFDFADTILKMLIRYILILTFESFIFNHSTTTVCMKIKTLFILKFLKGIIYLQSCSEYMCFYCRNRNFNKLLNYATLLSDVSKLRFPYYTASFNVSTNKTH